MGFIRIPKEGILKGLSLGPHGRMEDANDAIAMIFEGGQYWLFGWCLVFILSVAIMNYAGFSVIKSLSATTASVLRQVSIILVWAVFLLPWGPSLCRVQDHFTWTALLGLVILIIGVWVYNDIIIRPICRKMIPKMKIGNHGENNEEFYELPKSTSVGKTEEDKLSLDVQHTVTETRVKKISACGIGP